MKRNVLRLNDKSTAGGVVVESVGMVTHHGVPVTFIGAKVSCPACDSIGHIVSNGPRNQQSFFDKEVALEGDLCVCGCKPLPVMLASQSDFYHTITNSSHVPWLYDEQIQVLDELQQPVVGRKYVLTLEAGEQIEGILDDKGYTQRVLSSIPLRFKKIEVFNKKG